MNGWLDGWIDVLDLKAKEKRIGLTALPGSDPQAKQRQVPVVCLLVQLTRKATGRPDEVVETTGSERNANGLPNLNRGGIAPFF